MPSPTATRTWSKAALFSAAAHGLAMGLILGALWVQGLRRPAPIEIDMAQPVPQVQPPQPPPMAQRREWVASKSGKAPVPGGLTESAEVDSAQTCPPPCPEVKGAYKPAALAETQPSLLFDPIGDDYPEEALRADQTGRVVAQVFIDAEGKVRAVKLLERSGQALNAYVIDKLSNARFSPARDAQGQAMPVSLIYPIRFAISD